MDKPPLKRFAINPKSRGSHERYVNGEGLKFFIAVTHDIISIRTLRALKNHLVGNLSPLSPRKAGRYRRCA
jgi:hypothetical protein